MSTCHLDFPQCKKYSKDNTSYMLAMDQSLEQQDSNKRPDGVQVSIIVTGNKEKSHKCTNASMQQPMQAL